MKHFYTQAALREAMSGAIEAPPEKAEFFLGGRAGKAWFVIAPSTAYVVALRDDTLCAVHAQNADAAATRKAFIELVADAPEPLQATTENAAELGPNDEHISTIAYSWSRPEDERLLLFVLTTTDSDEATVQAMASMALVDKPDDAVQSMPSRDTTDAAVLEDARDVR